LFKQSKVRSIKGLLFAAPVLSLGIFCAGAVHPALAAADCSSKSLAELRIILDVGHAPNSPGAISARGVREHQFNRNLAGRIHAKLIAAGLESSHLLLTEETGPAGFRTRIRKAEQLNGDFLLSIHHDSVNRKYLQKWRYQQRERYFSDKFSGYSIFVSKLNPQFPRSMQLATLLGDALRGQGLKFTNHHAEDIEGERRTLLDPDRGVYQYDGLAILRGVKMPAMLLEAGVIVNRDEEILLGSAEYQDKIADAVVDAVTKCSQIASGDARSAR
jgi:N-acetylmuramoyl-L-alanine amidase